MQRYNIFCYTLKQEIKNAFYFHYLKFYVNFARQKKNRKEQSMGRILAIDYGQKRVGIAVTDDNQLIATGLQTIPTGELFDFLKTYLSKENVVLFVVGLPKQMDNTPSDSTKYITPFLKKLQSIYPQIPIKRVDERFTSQMAFQTMIDAGLKKKARQNKALVDTISATIILQSYMESAEFNQQKKINTL